MLSQGRPCSEHRFDGAERLLAELVALPSISLAQGELAPDPRYGEARVAGAVLAYLSDSGVSLEVDEIETGRPQVTARHGRGRPELVLTAHMDTVPPVAWESDPFRPEVIGRRLRGLGACDDKGSLAAMLLAFRSVTARHPELPGTLALVAMVGEEMFGVGSRHLVRSGYRPDAAIVGEPTEMRLVRVECGNVRWRFHTLGRAAHGSRPWEGDSAIYRMADALHLLRDEIAPECAGRSHPLIGRAALNVGVIAGGAGVNIVPDRCTVTVERRVLPGEDPVGAMDAVNDRLRARIGAGFVEFDPPLAVNHPVDTPEEAPIVRALQGALRSHGCNPEPTGVSFGSDANRFAEGGISTVVFGPGSIRQAHTRDEWIDLDEVIFAARLLEETVERFFSMAAPGRPPAAPDD